MTEYVEASQVARWSVLAGAVVLTGGGLWLMDFADGMAVPKGAPGDVLQVLADRALIAAAVGTLFWSAIAAFVTWILSKSLKAGQWPPPGIAMPRREKVRRINRPALLLALLAANLVLTALLVAAFWWRYYQLQGLAALVRG